MAMQFRPATREHAKARIALIGPSGSGKTKTGLLIALGLVGEQGRIAVIDTERGSASKYAGQGVAFDVLELETFAPATYVQAIHAAQEAGYDALIVDSLSHAWMGKDGALEMVDGIAKRSQSSNSFIAWRDVTPHHNRLVDALVSVPMHLIVTMRSKMEYVLEDVDIGGGKTQKKPRKVGLAPIQRDGLEYEFDIVGELTLDHDWIISKTRCELFDKVTVEKPGVEFGEELLAWLNTGETPKPRLVSVPDPEPAPAPAARSSNTSTRGRTIRHAGHARGEPHRLTRQQTPAPAGAPATGPAAAPSNEPCFSVSFKWSNSAEWSGKPLRSAPLATLQAYYDAMRDAIANPANKNRLRVMTEHRELVAAAIKNAEPPPPAATPTAPTPESDQTEPTLVPADDGWNLNGQGGQHDDDTTH